MGCSLFSDVAILFREKSQFYSFRLKVKDYQKTSAFSRSWYLLTISHFQRFHRKTTAPALLLNYSLIISFSKTVLKHSLSGYVTFSVFEMNTFHLETMFYRIHTFILVWHFCTTHHSWNFSHTRLS